MNRLLYIALLAITFHGTTFSGKSGKMELDQTESTIVELTKEAIQQLKYRYVKFHKPTNDSSLAYPTKAYPTNIDELEKKDQVFIAKITWWKKRKNKRTLKKQHFLFCNNHDAKDIVDIMNEQNGKSVSWYYVEKNE